jgi:hypothetical protein
VVHKAPEQAIAGDEKSAGFEEHRTHVGAPEDYDVGSAIQFNLLTTLGLRDYHYLLDVGCGSLRGGRLFIPYLRPGRYFGIEPLEWLVKEGIEREVGESAIQLKKPQFSHDENFTLTTFGRQFDFILAQSIFSHASQAQISRCLAEARKVMKPESVFAATFCEGTRNYEGNRWVACAEYTLERMQALIEAQGLLCRPFTWPHQDVQRWVLILHPEGNVQIPNVQDTNRLAQLENQVARLNRQLLKVRSRLLIRVGKRVKFFPAWLGFKSRDVTRRLRRLMGR